jgi:hypothetical protein
MIIFRWNAAGTAFIFITHDLVQLADDAQSTCAVGVECEAAQQ